VNFSEMTKEQKQLLILAVGGTITMFFILSNLVIGPMREDAAAAREVIEELENTVYKGERVLQRSVLNRRSVKDFSAEVLSIHRDELPPRFSPYIWAVEVLSLLAEKQDLVIAVQEHPELRYMPARDGLADVNKHSVPYWIPYTVDVTMDTSFANLKNFLQLLHEELPFAAVAGLRIQASISDPERHEISLMVEWPTLRFEDDLTWLQENSDSEESL